MIGGTLAGAMLMAALILVLTLPWGTARFSVGETVLIRPSVQTGLVVAVNRFRRHCRYRVRTAEPVREQWMREPGLEPAP
jgi:hypothetical protein